MLGCRKGELCVALLLVATAPSIRALVTPVIDTYRVVVIAISAAYSALHEDFGYDARSRSTPAAVMAPTQAGTSAACGIAADVAVICPRPCGVAAAARLRGVTRSGPELLQVVSCRR